MNHTALRAGAYPHVMPDGELNSMDLIPILSLIIAVLAVFFGPLLSARSAKRAMLGPMRQKWINDLRELLSEISSRCLHYFQAGYEDRTDEEYQHITLLEHRIIFMINQNEPEHISLVKTIRKMVGALDRGKNFDSDFIAAYEKLLKDGQDVLKHEWDVVNKA
jgi:hypothetical protein